MKKGILFFSACLILAACHSNSGRSGSDERFSPEQQRGKMLEQMTQELELTPQQQKELKAWFDSSREKRKKILKEKKGNRKNIREMVEKNRKEMTEELKKILTEEQFLKYEKFERERRTKRGNPERVPHQFSGATSLAR